ncbi:alpha-amylase family glycosyl hydrolase [Pontibacter chitinilyticus]|uniref:alpha-amylase family glycosyl hydrolase n=1 Tax=Pontibacter chitinilyticus TaxID=2674989 RepID=UPI003219B85B
MGHYRLRRADLKEAIYYAFQVQGCSDPLGKLCNIDTEKILLDPYARNIFFRPDFSRSAASPSGTNLGKAPLGYIAPAPNHFDWQQDHITPHTHDLIIYELHVRGFTRHPNSDVIPESRGAFAGVIEQIPYLQELGVTAVELMPVHQFDQQSGEYWGYMPLHFFAPHKSYAAIQAPYGAVIEFKRMVRELHKAGTEVILDVVFNHTTEEGLIGPTYHLKGVDPSTYYL